MTSSEWPRDFDIELLIGLLESYTVYGHAMAILGGFGDELISYAFSWLVK